MKVIIDYGSAARGAAIRNDKREIGQVYWPVNVPQEGAFHIGGRTVCARCGSIIMGATLPLLLCGQCEGAFGDPDPDLTWFRRLRRLHAGGRLREEIAGRWMEYDTAEPFDGDIGDLKPADSIDAAEHDGGAGVVIAPDDTRIYWED